MGGGLSADYDPRKSQIASEASDIGKEFNQDNLDMKKLIGGPLQAIVDAQFQAASTTIMFINRVGYEGSEGVDAQTLADPKKAVNNTKPPEGMKPRMMTFTYNAHMNGIVGAKAKLEVPLLCMIPIPSLRIDEATIWVNIKINSINTTKVVSDDLMVNEYTPGMANIEYANNKLSISNFNVTAVNQRFHESGSKVEKEYNLGVKVRVVGDQLPSGLDKLLTILENSIQEEDNKGGMFDMFANVLGNMGKPNEMGKNMMANAMSGMNLGGGGPGTDTAAN